MEYTLANSHGKKIRTYSDPSKKHPNQNLHVLGASKNRPEKSEKNRNKMKQRKSTLLSSLLDFYSYIYAFGLRFLFRLLEIGEI